LKIEYAVQLTIIDERLVCVRFGSVYIGVAAQAPEIFSRFLFDSASLGSLVGSVGPLTAPVFGLSLANGTATTILVTGRSTISLDWSGQGFNSGFYVSFWFRFVDRNASLNETKLFTSQSVNISVALDSTTDTRDLECGIHAQRQREYGQHAGFQLRCRHYFGVAFRLDSSVRLPICVCTGSMLSTMHRIKSASPGSCRQR
jgi:hypothetical protein